MNVFNLDGLLKAFFPKPPKRVLPSAANVSSDPVEYIANCSNARNLITLAMTADILRAFPFWAPARLSTIGRLAMENSASAGANLFRIGIYRNVPNPRSFYPGVLLDQSGDFTGAAALQTYACSVALERNVLYWLVCFSNSGITVRALDPSAVSNSLGVEAGATGTTIGNLGISVASTYGTMPSTFPAGGAYITNVAAVPALRYQFSA